ncbi:hypothetical protein Tco_0685887 [Tanacetum coccineum]
MLFIMPSWKQVNPPYKFKWTEKTVPVAEGSSETTTEGYMENYKNVSQDIQDQLNAKAEAVQIILTGIDNDIYFTVNAYLNACEMWKAIERLKQGESINVQDLETNLYWEFGKFTSRDSESLESYYSRFYKMMNEFVINQCDVTNHQVNVQFLLQLQPEWQRNKGKEIVNSPPPTYDQEPNMVTEDDALLKENRIDKLMALISLSLKKSYKPTNNNLRTSSNKSRANQDNSLRINRGTAYDNQRAVNVAGARENIEQADWRDDTDDEPNNQEFEAHYMYMAQIQEVTPDAADNSRPIFDTEPLNKEQGDTNITIDSLDMSTNRETVDQDDDLARECDLLASLIEKLKCEIDDNKNRVISTTSVSRPQLKSNQLEDRVMHNNSQGKKQQVEDHRRNFKFSNNKTSITACNDSLNAKTLNVNFICVTYGKCVLNDNHDMCVLYYINSVNSRTKMPMAAPISTKEPK